MSTSSTTKDTVYIDVDDEITTIIDKLRSSPHKIVALVLPKRASVFQSIVNMKLLKRSAEAANKHVVLITSEAALMPLAGAVGLYVAKNPLSKPEIPAAAIPVGDDVIDASEDEEGFTAENAGSAPIGDLAAVSGTAAVAAATNDIETLALDDDEDEDDAAAGVAGGAAAGIAGKVAKPKKDKKLKIPNFNKFRALTAAGVVALILLIVGLYVCIAVLPKATITVTTDASDVNSSLTPTLDTAAQKLDKATLTVPAKIAQQQKTQSQQVAATGSKNNGDKATGNVKMTAKKCSGSGNPPEVAAGTGVSTGGQTYITQESTSFSISGYEAPCAIYTSNNISITAQAGGAKYNTDGSKTFTVAGRSDASASGSASGGTDDIVKVVQQGDIDGAKQKITTSSETESVKTALKQQLKQDGQYALPDTFDAGEPAITSSSNVGDQADNVTVTAIYTYTMFGTEKDNLDTLLNDDIKGQVDTSKETILTNGLDKAQIRVIAATPTTKKINLQTTGTVGPELHQDALKKQAAGKKSGEVIPMIKNLPGVTDVKVHLSPFWVSSVPKNTSKITIVVDKASTKK
ncbi:MAG: hypothetical protein ABIR37_00155 [Candidatus Saccharimonadales bacterium]